MGKNIYKKNAWDLIRSAVLPVLFTAVIICVIVYGLNQTQQSSRAEASRILEDSIRRAVITAYAIEGRYPDTIQHIEEHFSVYIDWDRFVIHYQVFASNIFPDIAVIEL